MSKAPKPPQAPNPYQVSGAQTQSNINSAIAGSYLNNTNQVTPYGTVTYSYGNRAATPAAAAATPAAAAATPAAPAAAATNRPAVQPYGTNRPFGGNYNTNTSSGAFLARNAGGAGGGGGGGGGGTGTAGGGAGGGHATNAAADPYAAANASGELNLPGIKTAIPQVTQTTTLSPEQQKILDQSQDITLQTGDLGQKLMKNVPTGPLSFANAPAMPTQGGMPDIGKTNAEARDAVYQQQTAMLDPQWNMQERQLTDSLQAQGIPQGSEAYTKAMSDFNRQRTLAYQQAKDSAIQQGYAVGNQTYQQGMQEQTTGYGQGLQSRQQGVGEASTLYNQPITTLGSLMSAYGGGNVQSPQGTPYPSAVAPTDVTGAFGLAQAGNLAAYQGGLQQYGANVGGISGLAGMLALSAMQK